MPISSTCQSSKATAECNIKIGSRIHVAYLLRPTEVARQHVSVTLKLAASFMLPCYFGGWLSAAVNPLKKHNTIIADSCLRHIGRSRVTLLCAAFIHELEALTCQRMTPSSPYNMAAARHVITTHK